MKPSALILAAVLLMQTRCDIPTQEDATGGTVPDQTMRTEYRQTPVPTTDTQPPNRTLDSLCTACRQRMLSADYAGALALGERMEQLARSASDREAMLWACGFKGTALLAADSTDAALSCLQRGLRIWNSLQTDSRAGIWSDAIYMIYNTMGIYSINVELDYAHAIDYFLQGMELSQRRSDGRRYVVFCSNLVVAHFLRNDPAGVRYAEDVYQYGVVHRDRYALFSGSYVKALMYYMTGRYTEASASVEETLALVDSFYGRTGVYTLHANIQLALGHTDQAARSYETAVGCTAGEHALSVSYTYLCAGRFRLEQGNAQGAIQLLEKGVAAAREGRTPVFRYLLCEALSQAYAMLGDYRTALAEYRAYREGAERVFDAGREYAIRELQLKYETASYQKQIQEDRLRMERQRRRLQAIAALLALTCGTLLFIWRLYRNRSRLYRRIVSQWQQSLAREHELQERIAALELKAQSPQGDTSDRHEQSLFRQIDDLMRREELYREKGLTRERVAELAGTNRTYLSQVVNRCTGMGFNHYVNRFRIEEAIRLLSDPEHDVQLKALVYDLGFSSPTTFYSLFRALVGMTPSQYRSTIEAMHREHTELKRN